MGGGKTISEQQEHELFRIVPHARTLRKAREQIKCMVTDCASHIQTRNYLHRFVMWWTQTTVIWSYQDIVYAFIQSCQSSQLAAVGYGLLIQPPATGLRTDPSLNDCRDMAA